jgi:nucleoside-diphosphate-sugar epimerase
MKILVTGGAGYIGSVLTPLLLAQGYDVTVIDNMTYDKNSLASCCQYESFQLVSGDCRDTGLIKAYLAKVDIVIPLAALVGAPLCKRDEVGARTINYEAIKLMCQNMSDQQRMIFPTTNSGYGIGETGAICTENSPLRPISLYGVTKVQAEAVILDRPNSITFRLATVFGMSPRMRLDLLVNDFVHRAIHDRALIIFEGHFRRNYIHIQDVAHVFVHALAHFEEMKGRPYNVGLDDANLSKLELCAEIKKQVPEFVYMEAPIGEDPDKRDYAVSNARILATKFLPEWSLARGIRELITGLRVLVRNSNSNV